MVRGVTAAHFSMEDRMGFTEQRRYTHAVMCPHSMVDYYIRRDIEAANRITLWDNIEVSHFNRLEWETDILKAVA